MERPLDLPDLFSSSTAAASCSSNNRRRLLPPRAGGAIAADADGRLYVVRADGGISCGDIRDELLLDGKVRRHMSRENGSDWKRGAERSEARVIVSSQAIDGIKKTECSPSVVDLN